jgi:hypothetical protein
MPAGGTLRVEGNAINDGQEGAPFCVEGDRLTIELDSSMGAGASRCAVTAEPALSTK